MKKSLYGKKMFIADLLIVSLWSLFVWHFAWGRIMAPAMIGLRLALCFILHRRSRWSFFNAVLFTAMYIGLTFDMPYEGIVFRPIVKIAYVICCLFGYSEWAIHAFDCNNVMSAEVPICIFLGLYTLWLTVVPIVCSWKFKSILPLFRHHKKILWYVGAVAALFIYVYFTDKDASLFVCGLFLSLTPLAYRSIYRKGKPALLQTILRNRALMMYISIASVLFSAILIGLYEVNAAKPFASSLFPIALYIIALKACLSKSIKTTPALLLGSAGFLYMLVYNRPHEMVIILLCVSGLLSLVGVLLFYRQCRSIFTVLLLLFTNIFVLPVSLLGYNPYAAMDVNEVTSLGCNNSCYPRGLYEFKQYGSIGLRDRYGIILHANYQKYDYLDNRRDYIVLYTDSRDWKEYAIEEIYDLKRRRNILPDDIYGLYRIEKIRENVYAIYDDEENRIFTLRLPGVYNGLYGPEIQLINCNDEKSNGIQLPSDVSDMTITKSDDGKLTLYAYDTGLGGTSPDYSTYIQYESGDSTMTDYLYPLTESDYICASDIHKDGVDICDGSFSTIIAQIPLSETETGYIIAAYNKASSIEGSSEACLVKYVDGKLTKIPFEKKHGEICNSVSREYYIPDWYFTTDGLGWDWVLSFDKETNVLYIPEDDDMMVMSDRYDLYQFTNGKMRYTRNDAGYWLHPSLRDFHYLAGIYQTESTLIRIDALIDHTYRYSAWPKSKPMSSKPELVMTGGKVGIIKNAIVFKNGDYIYIVPEYRRGQGDDFGKVIIKYKNRVIQESEV